MLLLAMPFKRPTSNVFRNFLYLDGDQVINALSALEGGDVDEILTRTGEEGGASIGGELGAGPVKAKAGRNRGRKLEEEMLRKRTLCGGDVAPQTA